ncbi:MAG: hypothetical protein K6U04_08740 [Armatimonadetes bacterium]|nr:hypothetical protein [Armatimonadota bacterium]
MADYNKETCPEETEKVPLGYECPYCGEDMIDNILAPDEDNFCFCCRCGKYYYVEEKGGKKI